MKPMKLRYSLRAILVAMTLLALWCAYSVNWIRQRRAAIDSNSVHPGQRARDLGKKRTAPAMLWMFGEPGYFLLTVDLAENSPEFARIQALFPEAACWGNVNLNGEPL